jgi:hypothetical protein
LLRGQNFGDDIIPPRHHLQGTVFAFMALRSFVHLVPRMSILDPLTSSFTDIATMMKVENDVNNEQENDTEPDPKEIPK